MNARYLVRLDDACSRMDTRRWQGMEDVLDDLGIRPIVAVVPENLDPVLDIDPPDARFWDKVRRWQAKGWTIAMHGYQHQFHAVDRRRLVLPFYDRSEFAGLPQEAQAAKIRASWNLFAAQGVEPTAWVAPAHCFDRATLRALADETSIRIVSDGIARDQYYEDGFFWLPQQLWSFLPQRNGLWTICVHPNSMDEGAIHGLRATLAAPAREGVLVSVQDLELRCRPLSLGDRAYASWFWNRSRFYAAVAAIRRRLAGAAGRHA